MSTPLTWAELYQAVRTAVEHSAPGLGCANWDVIRRYTATARHQWRVRVVREAAVTAIRDILNEDVPDCGWEVKILCDIELNGVGGRMGLGYAADRSTASTLRGPWAQDLGKGRRHADDGRAWDAALREVAGDDLSPKNMSWEDVETHDALARMVVWLAPVAGNSFALAYARAWLCRAVTRLQEEIVDGTISRPGEPVRWALVAEGANAPAIVRILRIWAQAVGNLTPQPETECQQPPDVPDAIPSECE